MVSLFRLIILLLSVWGSHTCWVSRSCSLLDYQEHTLIGSLDPPRSSDFSLSCVGDFMYDQYSSIRWLSSSTSPVPHPIDVAGDPNLRANGINLEFRNVTEDYEALYYCQAEYANGSLSDPEGIGCVYVAGRAFYKTCPTTPMGGESCATATELQAEVGESVEFDTRIEFRHGGSCGLRQNVRLMFLDKVSESGDTETLFMCSNLRRFSNIPTCRNHSRVSVSFQGTSKYDIKLQLNNLTEVDSGRYRVRVDLNNFEGGRRSSIYKNFSLILQDPPTPSATVGCSGPLLLLNGEVLSTNSTIEFAEIMEGQQALLCATANEDCCNSSGISIAQFISPSNTPVTETPSSDLYVTEGKQSIRLNRHESATELEEGTYCCSISGKHGNSGTNCIKIVKAIKPCRCHDQ